jgi:hypothetical protein
MLLMVRREGRWRLRGWVVAVVGFRIRRGQGLRLLAGRGSGLALGSGWGGSRRGRAPEALDLHCNYRRDEDVLLGKEHRAGRQAYGSGEDALGSADESSHS